MIQISKSTAQNAIRCGRLPKALVKQGITIVMKRADSYRWLAALRDGKQQQGTGALYTPDEGHCCLGLEQAANWGGQCELETDSFGNLQKNLSYGSVPFAAFPSFKYLRSTGKMYFTHRGLKSQSPDLWCEDVCQSAELWNDNEDLSFAELADLIEKHLAVY